MTIYLHQHYGIDAPFIFGNKEDGLPSTFQRWLKRVGYIYSRRSFEQSIQSRYVNSAMLKEIIENNSLTMVFQNSKRLRTGKFYRRTTPDLAIQWLIDAYTNIPSQAERLVIVPMMISYDRIFETHNVTSEMVKAKDKELGFFKNMRRINHQKADELGDAYVKYLDPIHLKDFFKKEDATSDIKPETHSFKLANELYVR